MNPTERVRQHLEQQRDFHQDKADHAKTLLKAMEAESFGDLLGVAFDLLGGGAKPAAVKKQPSGFNRTLGEKSPTTLQVLNGLPTDRPIQVTELVNQLGMSRRAVESRLYGLLKGRDQLVEKVGPALWRRREPQPAPELGFTVKRIVPAEPDVPDDPKNFGNPDWQEPPAEPKKRKRQAAA
jgi:hypothetical protein